MEIAIQPHYAALRADIKQRFRQAQTGAMPAVNAKLIRLCWQIGALNDSTGFV